MKIKDAKIITGFYKPVGIDYAICMIPSYVKTIPNMISDIIIPAAAHITYLYMPDSVTCILSEAFCNDYIKKIIFSKNLKHIGSYAFYGNLIKDINLPESLTYIDDSAFSKCINLKSVSLPSKLKYIGCDAFHSCFDLKYVDISKCNILNKGNGIFKWCDNIEKVKLPENIAKNYVEDLGFSNIVMKLIKKDYPELFKEES